MEASSRQLNQVINLISGLSHDEMQNLVGSGDLLKAIAKTKRRPKNPKEIFEYIMYGIIKSPKGKIIRPPEGMDPKYALDILEAVANGKIDVATYFETIKLLDELKRFYTEVFQEIPAEEIEAEFSGLIIPKRRDDLNWLIVVLKGLVREQLFAKCCERFNGKAWKYYDDLNTQIVKAPRNTSRTYAIWTRDGQEADEIHKNKSPEVCRKENLNIVTAEERMLQELIYHWKTGDHLGRKTGTITSSIDSVGDSVIMRWREVSDGFYVGSIGPRNSDPDWRAREAVS